MLGFYCCGESTPSGPCGCCIGGNASDQLLVQIPPGWSSTTCETVAGSYVTVRTPHPIDPATCFWKYEFDIEEPNAWTPIRIEVTLKCDTASTRLGVSITYMNGFVTWLRTWPAGTSINCVFSNFQVPFETNSIFIPCQFLAGTAVGLTAL